MPQHQASSLQFFLPLLILIPILYWRMRKMTRPQPLKLERLWIRPALILLATGVVLFVPQQGLLTVMQMAPPERAGLALAAGLGTVAGWYWGRTTHIEVRPEDGTLMSRGSLAAMLVIVALVIVKLGLKPALAAQGPVLHLDVLVITDGLIVFSALLFTVRSLEMYLRARRVMDQVRALP